MLLYYFSNWRSNLSRELWGLQMILVLYLTFSKTCGKAREVHPIKLMMIKKLVWEAFLVGINKLCRRNELWGSVLQLPNLLVKLQFKLRFNRLLLLPNYFRFYNLCLSSAVWTILSGANDSQRNLSSTLHQSRTILKRFLCNRRQSGEEWSLFVFIKLTSRCSVSSMSLRTSFTLLINHQHGLGNLCP